MTLSRQELLDLVERMPAFPASVHRIIELTNDVNCQARDLLAVIDTDPVLTMRILKVANSAYFGLQNPILSVKHAVVYIGLNTVKHLALATAAIGAIPTDETTGLDTETYLRHSLGAGIVCRRLGQRVHIDHHGTADLFVAGLLHDIGKVVFASFEPTSFRAAVELAESAGCKDFQAEYQIFGSDHAELGGLLASKWGFPHELTRAIAEHHQPIVYDTPTPLRDVVYLASAIMHRLQDLTRHRQRLERLASASPEELETMSPQPPGEPEEPDLPACINAPHDLSIDELIAQMPGLSEELAHTQNFV